MFDTLTDQTLRAAHPDRGTPAMPHPDDATLTYWEASHYRVLRAAAAIARQAQGQQPATPVTASAQLAATLDISTATVDRAKRLLATAGIIRRGDNTRYYTT